MIGSKYIVNGIKYGASKCSQICCDGVKQGASKIKPSKKYQLLEKIDLPVAEYPEDWRVIPDGAVKFRKVKIGKASEPEYNREIVSFFDGQNRRIKRFQKGSDIPNTLREYNYSHSIDTNSGGVKIREILTDKFLPSEHRWVRAQAETQYVGSEYSFVKRKSYPKLHITKTDYAPDRLSRTVTLTEFPTANKLKSKFAKKELKINIEHDYLEGYFKPSVTGMSGNRNVLLPDHDKFLQFRFLRGSEKQKALANHFIEEKGLKDAKINVGSHDLIVEEGTNGHFDNTDGSIWFREHLENPVNTAAHEVEHAWQYSIMGRVFGRTDYERRCAKLYGPLKTQELHNECQKLAQAHAAYPAETTTPDGEISKEYWDNYLEVKARDAAEKAERAYNEGRDFILKQFKLIPRKDA